MAIIPGGSLRAWNDCGHMLIALLTYRQFAPQQKETIQRVLSQHPHYESFLTSHRPGDVSAEEWAFLRAATWPDYVRGADHRANFHRARWHYINLPFIPDGEERFLSGTQFETPTINILFSIDECRDLLREEYPAASRKGIHLAWLEHLIGDIHQPLHCITLVNRKYPRGDLGGNLLAVRAGETVKRLHAYWDDALGGDTSYPALAKMADEMAADPKLTRDHFAELQAHTTPRSWAEEGFALGKQYVYLNGTLPVADYDSYEQRQVQAHQVPLLPDDYEKEARSLSRRRAMLASYRLADAISHCLPSP